MNDSWSCAQGSKSYEPFRNVDDRNYSRLWAQRTKCYEQLMFMVDVNDSESWAQGFRCYHHLRPVDDRSCSTSRVDGSKIYEQFKFVDNMNKSESCELKPLGARNSLGLWMIWMILGREPKDLNVMNQSRLWMTHGSHLKGLHAMNNLGLWLIWMTLCCQLRAPNAMNNLELWMIWTTWNPMSYGL